MEIFWVLGIPLFGGFLLALLGTRKDAPEINSAGSLLTLVAAGVLTARVVSDGSIRYGRTRARRVPFEAS